jgi:putative transposase
VKKSRFTEAQIVAILKELDAGTTATELARRHGLHGDTIRQWRDKYAGLETSDLTRLKQLEAESARKDRRPGADRKKRLEPSRRKEAVRALQEHGLSQVRACAIVGQPRRTLHYHGKPKDDSAIAERTQTLTQERPRWGWRRLLIMIRRGGVEVGEFRFRRIYRNLASTPTQEAQSTLHRRQRFPRRITAQRALVSRFRPRPIGKRPECSGDRGRR